MLNVYKEYVGRCNQLGLTEIFTTKSKSTYEFMLRCLKERKLQVQGYMDDWNCKFEIRFK